MQQCLPLFVQIPACAEILCKFLQRGGGVRRVQIRRDLPHQNCAVTKILTAEAELFQQLQIVQQQGGVLLAGFHGDGLQKGLPHGRLLGGHQPVKVHPLMGGVLVDEPEGLRVILADNVSVQDFSGNAPRGCLRQHRFLPRQFHGSLLGRDGGNGRNKGLRGRGGFHRLFRHGNHRLRRLGGHGGRGLAQGAGGRALHRVPGGPDGLDAVRYLGSGAPFRVPGGLDRRSR